MYSQALKMLLYQMRIGIEPLFVILVIHWCWKATAVIAQQNDGRVTIGQGTVIGVFLIILVFLLLLFFFSSFNL